MILKPFGLHERRRCHLWTPPSGKGFVERPCRGSVQSSVGLFMLSRALMKLRSGPGASLPR